MSTRTRQRTREQLTTGEPVLSHIIAARDGEPGHVRVLRARVEGTPLTAMCGHVLVPSRDPASHPTCPRCLAVFEALTGATEGWRDA